MIEVASHRIVLAAASFSGDEATAVTRRAERHAQLHGRQSDPTARAEHDQLVARRERGQPSAAAWYAVR